MASEYYNLFEDTFDYNKITILVGFGSFLMLYKHKSYEISLTTGKDNSPMVTNIQIRTPESYNWNSIIMQYLTAKCQPERDVIGISEIKDDVDDFNIKFDKTIEWYMLAVKEGRKVPLKNLMEFVYANTKEMSDKDKGYKKIKLPKID